MTDLNSKPLDPVQVAYKRSREVTEYTRVGLTNEESEMLMVILDRFGYLWKEVSVSGRKQNFSQFIGDSIRAYYEFLEQNPDYPLKDDEGMRRIYRVGFPAESPTVIYRLIQTLTQRVADDPYNTSHLFLILDAIVRLVTSDTYDIWRRGFEKATGKDWYDLYNVEENHFVPHIETM